MLCLFYLGLRFVPPCHLQVLDEPCDWSPGEVCKAHGWHDQSFKAEVIAAFLATTLTSGSSTLILRVFCSTQVRQSIPEKLAHREVWEKIFQRVGMGSQTRPFYNMG